MIELRFNSNPKNPEEWIKLFIHACSNGDLDLVRMLFEPEFKSISNLHYGDEEGFRIACGNGHLDIVKFLTTSSELLASAHSFVDIHAQDEEGFQLACDASHWNIVKFLIFDLNIEKTKTIVKIIQKYPQTESYFEAREERKKLSECIKSIPSLQNSIDYDSQDLNSNLTSIRI